MKTFFFICFSIFFMCICYTVNSQEKQDVVYLKNGSIIKGEIIEQIPNVSLKIKTRDGSTFVYKMDEIEKITKENMKGEEDYESNYKSSSNNSGFIGSFGSGISLPLIEGGFTDFSLAWNIHGNAGYLFNHSVAAGLDIQYNSFEGGDFTILTLLADMKIGNFKKTSNINPYATIGFGMYFLSAGVGSFSISETNIGVRFGGGSNFKVSKNVGIFGEISLDYNFNDGTAKGFLPIKAGVMITP